MTFSSRLRTSSRLGHSYPLGSASIRAGCLRTRLGSLPYFNGDVFLIEGAFFLVLNAEHAPPFLRVEFDGAVRLRIMSSATFALVKFSKCEKSKLGSRTRVAP